MSKHPQFRNPQLAEVVCEIHYSVPHWKPTFPGEFFKQVLEDYPELEPVTEQNVVIQIGPEGIPIQQLASPKTRFRLKSKNGPFILQLSEQIFSLNIVGAYPGWNVCKLELAKRWKQYSELIQPAFVSRLGLRYINRIPLSAQGEKPNHWLKASSYIPNAALDSGPGFLMRLEKTVEPGNRLMVTLANDQAVSTSEPYGSMLLDIDRILESTVGPKWESLEGQIDNLHDAVWDVFDSVRSQNLTTLLEQA